MSDLPQFPRRRRCRFWWQGVLVATTLPCMKPACASFGGNSFGDGFVWLLGLVFVMPPLLGALLAGALTRSRVAAIPVAIVVGSAISTVVWGVVIRRGLVEWLSFALLGAIVGLAAGALVWLWRIGWSKFRRKACTVDSPSVTNTESSPATIGLLDPIRSLLGVSSNAAGWRCRAVAWGRQARANLVEAGSDLRSSELERSSAERSRLRVRLGYSAVLILAGLALSPITLMGLTEKMASSSSPPWLVAWLVAIANGLPLLRVVPSLLDVLAAVLVGPWWGAGTMLITARLLSSHFAGYPSLPYAGVFGVLIAGLAYRATGKIAYVVIGEIVGTGLIGAIVNAALGIYATDTLFDWPDWVAMLFLPTSIGAALGGIALIVLRRAEQPL